MITAYIGVGTNIDREQHAKVAYTELQQLGEDLLVSPIYECEPIGAALSAYADQDWPNARHCPPCHDKVWSQGELALIRILTAETKPPPSGSPTFVSPPTLWVG